MSTQSPTYKRISLLDLPFSLQLSKGRWSLLDCREWLFGSMHGVEICKAIGYRKTTRRSIEYTLNHSSARKKGFYVYTTSRFPQISPQHSPIPKNALPMTLIRGTDFQKHVADLTICVQNR